jgi:hypothetical protein
MKTLSKLSDIEKKREYIRTTKLTPVRDRRRVGPRFGADPAEQRANHTISGSILERIVYQQLLELLGPEGSQWLYKKGLLGGRTFKGGVEIDFVIERFRPLALEIQGAHWHGPTNTWKDTARALALIGEGFDYAEILEWEIWAGDVYLEYRLKEIIGL